MRERTGTATDRLTRPDRIGGQQIDVHLGMTDQRDSLLGRLGPDEAVALLRMLFGELVQVALLPGFLKAEILASTHLRTPRRAVE